MLDFLKKHWYISVFIFIIFLATLLRSYQFAQIPHGMTWDEAAIGYNGYAVATTRRDEWLDFLPISFQSFGDYKAPFAIYLVGLFTLIFDLSLFTVRLPFLLSSIFTVFAVMLLAKKVFAFNEKYKYHLSLLAGFLVTISPWHFHYSRVGFESQMALTFFVIAYLLLLNAFEKTKVKTIYLLLAISFFVLMIYTYHSSKVFVPLFALYFLFANFKTIWQEKIKISFAVIFGILLLIPFIYDSFWGAGLTRAGVVVLDINILKNFLAHFSTNFLIFGETNTLRHGTGTIGVLYPTTFIFVIAGLIACYTNYFKNDEKAHLKSFLFIIFAGILPAAITNESPHSNRAFLSFIGFIFVSIYGFLYLAEKIYHSELNKSLVGSKDETNIVIKSFIGTVLFLEIITSVYFFNHYFHVFAKTSANDFKDGYIEAMQIAKKYEKGIGVEPVEKIVFSNFYGQPYIYAIFVRQTNPINYRGGSLIKYQFSDKVDISDLERPNALVIGSSNDELPIQKADYLIYGSDGQVKFKIFDTRKYE